MTEDQTPWWALVDWLGETPDPAQLDEAELTVRSALTLALQEGRHRWAPMHVDIAEMMLELGRLRLELRLRLRLLPLLPARLATAIAPEHVDACCVQLIRKTLLLLRQ